MEEGSFRRFRFCWISWWLIPAATAWFSKVLLLDPSGNWWDPVDTNRGMDLTVILLCIALILGVTLHDGYRFVGRRLKDWIWYAIMPVCLPICQVMVLSWLHHDRYRGLLIILLVAIVLNGFNTFATVWDFKKTLGGKASSRGKRHSDSITVAGRRFSALTPKELDDRKGQ